MQYLVYYSGSAFYTNWFDVENNYAHGMMVFDLFSHKYTCDGINWYSIEEDHL